MPTDPYVWSISTENVNSQNLTTFDFADGETGLGGSQAVPREGPYYGDPVQGTIEFSPASTVAPEPPPILLMLLGAGLIFFMRKRFTMRLPYTA